VSTTCHRSPRKRSIRRDTGFQHWLTGEALLVSVSFIDEEMRRQVSNGDIVPVFQKTAWR
jgi:hypothetical protein